jgi:hypothetical protein
MCMLVMYSIAALLCVAVVKAGFEMCDVFVCVLHRYSCDCIPGFTGQHCETNINECASNPCANGGVCMDLVDSFKCECPRGYYDARCLSDVDECASNPCKNGGTCEDGVNQFICRCLAGYGGECGMPTCCSQAAPLPLRGRCQHSFFFLQASSASRTSMSAARTPVSTEACAGTT